MRDLVKVSLRGELSDPDIYLRPFFEKPKTMGPRVKSTPIFSPPHTPERPAAQETSVPIPTPVRGSRTLDIALGVAAGLLVAAFLRPRP